MRAAPRFVCDYPVTVLSAGGGRMGEGRFIDISAGGAALEGDVPLRAGISYQFVFEGLALAGRVSWLKGRRKGVLFIASKEQEEELRRLISKLKRPSPPRDYWAT